MKRTEEKDLIPFTFIQCKNTQCIGMFQADCKKWTGQWQKKQEDSLKESKKCKTRLNNYTIYKQA